MHRVSQRSAQGETQRLAELMMEEIGQLVGSLPERMLSAQHQQRQLSVASEVEALKYEEVSVGHR